MLRHLMGSLNLVPVGPFQLTQYGQPFQIAQLLEQHEVRLQFSFSVFQAKWLSHAYLKGKLK